jgi:hypothetical protein
MLAPSHRRRAPTLRWQAATSNWYGPARRSARSGFPDRWSPGALWPLRTEATCVLSRRPRWPVAWRHGDRPRKAATRLARGRREAVLRTSGTDRRGWLARGIPDLCWRRRLQMAGQRVEQKMASAEIGRDGPDGPHSRLSPNRASPPCSASCQLSSLVTQVSNGTSTIRRNDPGPSAGRAGARDPWPVRCANIAFS